MLEQKNMLEKTLTARIKLVYELTENLWLTDIDVGDFEDAILNMSINSMHAIADSGQIKIQTRNIQLTEADANLLSLSEGDYIEINHIDTGCGMDNDTKERIFEPFFTTKGERGTGLGLSQVYGFVERSGGTVTVYSEPEHGSRFVLYFPRSQQSSSKKQIPAITNTDRLGGNETILVVDDEEALAELAEDILTARG